MSSEIEIKKITKRVKHTCKWFESRIGKNVFRRVYNSISGKCTRHYFRIESNAHALSLYVSQSNGYRYDEN